MSAPIVTRGILRGMARRLSAVRAELAEAEARTDGIGQAMARALRTDVAVLEERYEAAKGAIS